MRNKLARPLGFREILRHTKERRGSSDASFKMHGIREVVVFLGFPPQLKRRIPSRPPPPPTNHPGRESYRREVGPLAKAVKTKEEGEGKRTMRLRSRRQLGSDARLGRPF